MGFNGLCLAAWVTAFMWPVGSSLAYYRVSFGLMALASAAALFWFIVPETYGLSSLCLVLGIVLAAVHVRKSVGNGWWIAVGGLLAGTVITNWMVIVVLSAVLKPRRDALIISAASLLLMFGAWGVQKLVFPAPASFPLKVVARERAFALHPDQGGVACKLAAELVSPMLVPVAHFIGARAHGAPCLGAMCGHREGGFSYHLLSVPGWHCSLTVHGPCVDRPRHANLGWRYWPCLVFRCSCTRFTVRKPFSMRCIFPPCWWFWRPAYLWPKRSVWLSGF